jgi:hypothetical protein
MSEALSAAERWAHARSNHQPMLATLLTEYTLRGAELVARLAEIECLVTELDRLRDELIERENRLALVATAHGPYRIHDRCSDFPCATYRLATTRIGEGMS